MQAKDIDGLYVVDFTTIVQATKTYEEYTLQMSRVLSHELEHVGIVLSGEKRTITKLTKHLSLFGSETKASV
jgi:hypothetical protein